MFSTISMAPSLSPAPAPLSWPLYSQPAPGPEKRLRNDNASALKPLSLRPRKQHKGTTIAAAKLPQISTMSPKPVLGVRSPSIVISQPSISVPRIAALEAQKSAQVACSNKRRPPPLSIGSASLSAPLSAPLSPSIRTASSPVFRLPAFGEASPSLYAIPTPSPVSWAPTFFVTPATPQETVEKDGTIVPSAVPPSPAWPRHSTSLKATIFDQFGQPRLSPMDLRGYMGRRN